jgi:hypothetical protein
METGKYKDKNGTTRVGDALRFLAKQGKAFAPELLELAANVTGVKALDKLGDAIRGDKALTPQDKDLLLAELNKDIAIEQEITKRWVADANSDNYASKNIRPFTLAFLLFCMFVFIMLDSALDGFKIAPEWIGLLKGLLMTAVGGYFVIRGAEKITKDIKK